MTSVEEAAIDAAIRAAEARVRLIRSMHELADRLREGVEVANATATRFEIASGGDTMLPRIFATVIGLPDVADEEARLALLVAELRKLGQEPTGSGE